MPMPALITQTGTGTSPVWTPDWMQTPFSVGIGVVNNTATYSIEFTMDNLDQPTATAVNWFPVAGMSTIAVATTGVVSFPVRGLRINAFTSSAGSTVSANFIQATFPR